MAFRGLGGPFPRADGPEEWTVWSTWEWAPWYSMYARSRENSEGLVEWQYAKGPPPAVTGAGSQSLSSIPAQQVLPDERPRYYPSGHQVLEQSNVPPRQSLATAFLTPNQGYPSTHPIPSTSLSSSRIPDPFVESVNQYSVPSLSRYQSPQSSSAASLPSSYQNRAAVQNTDRNKGVICNTEPIIANSMSRTSQEYYQQNPSDNYTSQVMSSSRRFYESSRPTQSLLQPQDELSSLSRNLMNESRQERDYRTRSLAEELDDMTIEPSIPILNMLQRNKGYPITLTGQSERYEAENEGEEGEDRYQAHQSKRGSSTTEVQTPGKTPSSKRPSVKNSMKRPPQPSSKPPLKSKSSPDDSKHKITAINFRTNPDVLDDRFRVEPSNKFETFTVFMMLWSEPHGYNGQSEQASDSNDDASIVTVAKLGENAYHSIRRFVVVVEKRGHSLCLPILTYTGQGTLKLGVKQEEHAIVYTGDKPPPQLEGENNIYKKPVKMIGYTKRDKLDPKSRINYSKIYTVEHNVKVCFIGYIDRDSEGILLTDYRRSVDPPRMERSSGSTMRRDKGDSRSSGKDRSDRRKSSR